MKDIKTILEQLEKSVLKEENSYDAYYNDYVKEVVKITVDAINERLPMVQNVKGMPYTSQYFLEKVINELEKLV